MSGIQTLHQSGFATACGWSSAFNLISFFPILFASFRLVAMTITLEFSGLKGFGALYSPFSEMLPTSSGSILHLMSASGFFSNLALSFTNSPGTSSLLPTISRDPALTGDDEGGEEAGDDVGVDFFGVSVVLRAFELFFPPAGAASGISEIVALADFVSSVRLVADKVTIVFSEMADGAVYHPSLVIVPWFGLIVHFTPGFWSPVRFNTCALNCSFFDGLS